MRNLRIGLPLLASQQVTGLPKPGQAARPGFWLRKTISRGSNLLSFCKAVLAPIRTASTATPFHCPRGRSVLRNALIS